MSAGQRRHAAGRGAIIREASSLPSPGSGSHYKPVSTDENHPFARVAIPGEGTVQESWRYLSKAPVAYQMQQMTNDKEGRRRDEEYPQLSPENQKYPLSLTQPHTTPTSAATVATTTDIPHKGGHTVHGKGKHITEGSGGGQGLWEPCIVDSFFHPPPDVASSDEFPSLMQSNSARRKKM